MQFSNKLPQYQVPDNLRETVLNYEDLEETFPVLQEVLIDFLLTVKAATLIFISGRGSAILTARQGKSGSIYNLVKNK